MSSKYNHIQLIVLQLSTLTNAVRSAFSATVALIVENVSSRGYDAVNAAGYWRVSELICFPLKPYGITFMSGWYSIYSSLIGWRHDQAGVHPHVLTGTANWIEVPGDKTEGVSPGHIPARYLPPRTIPLRTFLPPISASTGHSPCSQFVSVNCQQRETKELNLRHFCCLFCHSHFHKLVKIVYLQSHFSNFLNTLKCLLYWRTPWWSAAVLMTWCQTSLSLAFLQAVWTP